MDPKRTSREEAPELITPAKRSSAQYSMTGMRRGSHDDLRVQFDELKERHRLLRNQLQVQPQGKGGVVYIYIRGTPLCIYRGVLISRNW